MVRSLTTHFFVSSLQGVLALNSLFRNANVRRLAFFVFNPIMFQLKLNRTKKYFFKLKTRSESEYDEFLFKLEYFLLENIYPLTFNKSIQNSL